MLGAEIQDHTQMELDDVTDTLNGLMAAGFVEVIPFSEEVQLAEMPVTAFEIESGLRARIEGSALRR